MIYPRRDHHPKRRGLASASIAGVAAGSGATTGSGGVSAGSGAGEGCTSLIAPEENIGAGSRTVERRFGGSAAAGGSGGTRCSDGAACSAGGSGAAGYPSRPSTVRRGHQCPPKLLELS